MVVGRHRHANVCSINNLGRHRQAGRESFHVVTGVLHTRHGMPQRYIPKVAGR